MSYRKPVIKSPNRQRTGVIAALDIGTSKIACLIAENDANAGPVVKDWPVCIKRDAQW